MGKSKYKRAAQAFGNTVPTAPQSNARATIASFNAIPHDLDRVPVVKLQTSGGHPVKSSKPIWLI